MIKAVDPYIYTNNQLNFKYQAFKGWKETGAPVAKAHYPMRGLRKLVFNHDMVPTLYQGGEARLCFVQPVCLYFDTFSSILCHEVIPFFWDCWPEHYDMVAKWINRHRIRRAIFTSRQEMEAIKERVPGLQVLWCHEGVDASSYNEGALLCEREIDILEFGRANQRIIREESGKLQQSCNYVCTVKDGQNIYSEQELPLAMAKAKVTLCFPRSMTHPEAAGGVETLTQRYWEAMLSRIVIIGHAPQELIDVCGYNPVIEMPLGDKSVSPSTFILDILHNITDYQSLVDRNRQTALEHAPWEKRMRFVQESI